MGQAKNRGTFDERRAAAQAKDAEARAALASARASALPMLKRGKSIAGMSMGAMIASALAAGR